ncbi:MAG: hypothetical protein H3C47_04385 [Candidatus Cloacimonetes bacterium]|nr:hypothetical protein [Candidatus Cloacimonadota bacterium]
MLGPSEMIHNQLQQLLLMVPAVLLVSWVRGYALALTEACLLGRPWQRVSKQLGHYLDPMGSFAYLMVQVGWHDFSPFENPRLQKPKHQALLHLGAGLASIGVAGILQLVLMLVLHLFMGNESRYTTLLGSFSTVVFLSQLFLIGSVYLHLTPLPPAPGFKFVLYHLSAAQRFKLMAWNSRLILLVVVAVIFGQGYLHLPALVLLGSFKVGLAVVSSSCLIWFVSLLVYLNGRESL